MAERGNLRSVRDNEQEFTFKNVQLLKNESLGTGSYGAVCKAKCDHLICAAKLLYPVLPQMQAPDRGKELRQPFHRFELECQFLRQANHPNIVQYLGTYRDPETNAPVLLMELMDESLTHFLESSPGDIPYHIQVNLSQDIAQALAFLHANGIIHRNLSSNNVLLIAGSRAKVSDFRMSKFADINTTTCPGTQAFLSPEALDQPPVYTEKLDTFSFGVLLVQISTRQFPEPTDRFQRIEIPNPQNPSNKIKVLTPIPEVKRRQAHVSLIESSHSLLPTALKCLKDEAVKRPSSQQLCKSLDAIKRTVKYQKSLQHNVVNLLQQQLHEKDRQIRCKDRDLQVLKQEKDQQNQVLQGLQHEIEAKEHQLRRLNKQLESTDEITATLQHTIRQSDREISQLRQSSMCKDQDNTSQEPVNKPLTFTWETFPCSVAYSSNYASSAIVRKKAFFKMSIGSIWEFNPTCNQWVELSDPPVLGFSLVSIENELVSVGGFNRQENRFRNLKNSNKLYSYIKGNWVEKYPNMPTKRYHCAAVYTNHTLVVAGGECENEIFTTVEVLGIQNRRWSNVSSLPTPLTLPSASTCGEHIYLHDICAPSNSEYSVIRCSLFSLAFSTPKQVLWEKVASLPVQRSTLVTVKDHLLAVGGKTTRGESVKEVLQYNPAADLWQVVSQMKIARFQCAATLLPDNKLMVVGGAEMCELATVL